jgi:hypothetical protein
MLERGLFIIDFKQEMSVLKLKLRVNRSDLATIVENFFNNCFGSQDLVRFFGLDLYFHQLIFCLDVLNVVRTGGVIAFLSVDLHVAMDDAFEVVVIASFEQFSERLGVSDHHGGGVPLVDIF